MPVGGGEAWPGFETTRRAKLAARTARGRAAAHRHTQRPGPPAPGTPVGRHSSPPSGRPGHPAPRTPAAEHNLPCGIPRLPVRDKIRPALPLQRHFRENIRPAHMKTLFLGHFARAGRTFSHTRRDNVATLKPTTPLRAPEQQPLKPPSPLLAPNRGALKPASPLHPKNAPKTPISHPQRRWRFQLRLGRRPQRR